MKILEKTNKFLKEYHKSIQQNKDILKLNEVLNLLMTDSKLPIKYRNHKLKGIYNGLMELHIEPDWLLIYRIKNDVIILERTGSHADLFR